jgi:N-glycosidase YbiA
MAGRQTLDLPIGVRVPVPEPGAAPDSTTRPHRLAVRTSDFQSGCRGSIPLGVTDMSDKKVIDSFTTAAGYGFLSNFHPSTIYVNGKSYPTVEHAIQAHKTLDETSHDLIRRAKTPGEAKKLGRAVLLRPDWEEVKVDLMRDFVRKKFENPFLRPLLVATGDAELIEGNTWNDRFWGVCRGSGLNWLGKILMEIRGEILKNPDV